MPQRISYAQNGEDVRIWHAFGPDLKQTHDSPLTYVEVGANEPWDMSVTAALYELGWRGLLIEADPELAERLRVYRPGDRVVNAAASDHDAELTFYQVPGTGLGTLDQQEASAAAVRGFEVAEVTVQARTLDALLDEYTRQSHRTDIHALSIDVEGAEEQVLAGLSLTRHRPWVLCIEAVEPGTNRPTHTQWESHLSQRDYREVAFDGVNRWYVANERADESIAEGAGAASGMSIAEAIAMPFNILDTGQHGWSSHESVRLHQASNRAFNRSAWQREVILNEAKQQVPSNEYERQIDELRSALIEVQGSRTYTVSKQATRVAKRLLHIAQRGRGALPTSAANRLVRERHLKHVTINMGHLTDPAFLGEASDDTVTWLGQERPPLPPGLEFSPLAADSIAAIRGWLADHPFDSDDQLDSRMDNQDDEVGRVQSALRTRLRLSDASAQVTPIVRGNRIAFDARALQSPAFGTRGIGRFAKALLDGVRATVDDARITLIIDPGLYPLPEHLAGRCEQLPRIAPADIHRFGALVQPSPMTHSPEPLVPLLRADIHKVAVVFDFIPLHYSSVYLKSAAPRAEYAAVLDALRLYSEFLAISQVVSDELTQVLVRFDGSMSSFPVQVAWPREVTDASGVTKGKVDPLGPIVLMTGDDARKNTFGGLAGIAAATSDEQRRNVIVVGMPGQDTRVHHWSIAAAMRPGEATTLGRVTDNELTELLSSASCVVVPSFDEGLSLPVLEALRVGIPVVASDIPAHRELIGTGAFSCEPDSPRSIAQAIRKVRGSGAVASRQSERLGSHQHAILEQAIASIIEQWVPVTGSDSDTEMETGGLVVDSRGRLSIGIATPWPPQRSGVADFSRAVFSELASMADVTVYATSDGLRDGDEGIALRSITEAFDDPDAVSQRHDAFICVVGNSHYHLLPLELLRSMDAIVIAHDTRMVEFYTALRGTAGAERVMSIVPTGTPGPSTVVSLDDQIKDMRLLTNAGFWEVANRAQQLLLHSPSAAPVISEQTGRQVQVLPFANYRAPDAPTITEQDRARARERLGLDSYPDGTIHLGSFGYVDIRTKMSDIVIESAAWLEQWGHPVALHLVGSANPLEQQQLREHANRAGLKHFEITGYISEEQYRDWILAVDLGVQLRISPLLGVSGPLSDFAAYGTPAVASSGLCVDVDTPPFIHRLPDAVSPVMVAEFVETALNDVTDTAERESQRLDYLQAKSPRRYAELLFEILQEHQ